MYEFYRSTIVGRALMDLVDEKIKNNTLTPEQGLAIAEKFDLVISRYLKTNGNTISFNGKILSYNFVDGVWKFLTKDFEITFNNTLYKIPYLRIVACDSDTTGEGTTKRKKGRQSKL